MSTRPQHAGSMLHCCVRQACCVSQSMQQYGASGGVGKQEPVVSVQCISSRTMLHMLYNYSSRCCKSSTACLPVVCNPQTHGPDSAAHNCIGMLHNTGDFNTLGAVGHNVDDAIWEHQAAAIGLSGRLRVSVQQMHLKHIDLPRPPGQHERMQMVFPITSDPLQIQYIIHTPMQFV